MQRMCDIMIFPELFKFFNLLYAARLELQYPAIILSFVTDRLEISFQRISTCSSDLNINLGCVLKLKIAQHLIF